MSIPPRMDTAPTHRRGEAPPTDVDTSWISFGDAGEKPTVAKAVIAGVTTLAAGLVTALADNGITATEWVTVAAGTVLAVASVWATSNRPS
jgi:hypothetical protein